MKLILMIFFGIFSIGLNAKQNPNNSINLRVDKIEIQTKRMELTIQEIQVLKDKIDYQQKLNEQTLNSISTQLSSASFILSLFGSLFAIAGIGLGIYVTYVERKIVKISEENKDFLRQSKQIKEDVQETSRLMKDNLHGLFIKIRREETEHILERLQQVPEDISNFLQQFLSRELERDDYQKLKSAYTILKLKLEDSKSKSEDAHLNTKNCDDDMEDYLVLFFQHFADLAISDLTIKKEFMDYMLTSMDQAFENDILKSTNDLFTFFINRGIVDSKNEINEYFKSLVKSKYKNFKPLYESTFIKLRNRDSQFLVYELIESTNELKIAKIEYGQFLINAFSETDKTKSESVFLDEIEMLKTETI